MAQLSRRRVLQLSGGGTVAVGTGGLAAILAAAGAPALAKGTTVHWLKFVDFVPGSDELIKGKLKAVRARRGKFGGLGSAADGLNFALCRD